MSDLVGSTMVPWSTLLAVGARNRQESMSTASTACASPAFGIVSTPRDWASDAAVASPSGQVVEANWSPEERAAYLHSLCIVTLPGEELVHLFLEDVLATAPLPPHASIIRGDGGNVWFFDATSGHTTEAYPHEAALRQLAALCRECLHLPLDERHLCIRSTHRMWIAEAEGAVAMWRSAQAEGGDKGEYYYHMQTQETTWDHPAERTLFPYKVRLEALNRLVNEDYLRLLAAKGFVYAPATEISPERNRDAADLGSPSPLVFRDAPGATSELRRHAFDDFGCKTPCSEDSSSDPTPREDNLRVTPGHELRSPLRAQPCPSCLLNSVSKLAEQRADESIDMEQRDPDSGYQRRPPRPRGEMLTPMKPLNLHSATGKKDMPQTEPRAVPRSIQKPNCQTPNPKTPAQVNLEMACATWPVKRNCGVEHNGDSNLRSGSTSQCSGSAVLWMRRARGANAELEKDNDELRRLIAEALDQRKQEVLMKPLDSSASKEERLSRVDFKVKSTALKDALFARSQRCAARPESVATPPPTCERLDDSICTSTKDSTSAAIPSLAPLALINKLDDESIFYTGDDDESLYNARRRRSPRKLDSMDSGVQSTACSSQCPNSPRIDCDTRC